MEWISHIEGNTLRNFIVSGPHKEREGVDEQHKSQ
jgi:hypothetical protein